MHRLKMSQHALPPALSWPDLVCHPQGMDEDCTGTSMFRLQCVVLPKGCGQRSTSAPGAGWGTGSCGHTSCLPLLPLGTRRAPGTAGSCELRPRQGPRSQEAAACIPCQRWSHCVVPPPGGGLWSRRRGRCPPGEWGSPPASGVQGDVVLR